MTSSAARTDWSYLAREVILILLWAYVVLVGGTINGLFSFRLQAASSLVLGVLAALWLGARLYQRRGIPRIGVEWAVLIFIALQLGTTLLSQDVRRSLPIPALTMAYTLVVYGAYDLTRSGWPAELTEKTLLIVGGIVAGLALLGVTQTFLSWLAVVVSLPYAPGFEYRVYAPLGDANLNSSFLNLIVPLAIARALTTPARVPRLALGVLILATLTAQFFTSSRGGLAEIAASTTVLAVAWVCLVSSSAREYIRRGWAALRARPVIMAGLVMVILAGAALAAWRILGFRGSATQAPILSARRELWEPALAALRASPLWGSGPGTYPTDFVQHNSVPPLRPFLHAHNLYLNTAAESGLIGLVGLIVASAAVCIGLWRARASASLEHRGRWAAVAAMWVGFAVHSLVDDHTRYLSVALPLGVMLAVLLADSAPRQPRPTLHPLWLAAPGLVVGAFAVFSLRAQALAEQAANIGGNDWGKAAELFDEAAALDPALAFYWQQAGYAYGRLALNEPAALPNAIARLERARTLEPAYSLIPANLAALYEQAGRAEEAITAMQAAVERAPDTAIYPLNLGVLLETVGRESEARASYLRALDLNPLQTESSFWDQTPFRDVVRDAWQAGNLQNISWLARIQTLLDNGDLDAAERDVIAAWQQNDQNLAVYRGLAALARARGDLELARRYIECALWVQTVEVNEQAWAMLDAAEIAHESGEIDVALARYYIVLDAVTDYGAYGWGSGSVGWTPYAFFVFQRRGVGEELLPQLTRADFTAELGQRLLSLGALHEQRDEIEEAVKVYRRLLAADPALAEARLRLTTLGIP